MSGPTSAQGKFCSGIGARLNWQMQKGFDVLVVNVSLLEGRVENPNR